MNLAKFVCNPFEENTYLVWDDDGKALLLDPGFYDNGELLRAERVVCEKGLRLQGILNTHLHLDHCIGNGRAHDRWKISAKASEKDLFLLQNASMQAKMFGLDFEGTLPEPECFLKDGDTVDCGRIHLEVMEVPGHSPGSLAFYCRAENLVFAGDVLFRGSYGRTDLPGGSERELMQSICDRLLSLPAETKVLCGHGQATTIGAERDAFLPHGR